MRPIKAVLFEPACLADAEGPFEDVAPALAELKAMGIELDAAAEPEHTLYLTTTAAGIETARAAGMIPILLMHDPDEAMRLVANNPAGAVVSLLELPDFIRFVAAKSAPLPSPLLSAP